MPSAVGADADRFEVIRGEWAAVSPEGGLENDFERLTDEWRKVEWRSGGTTLLAALGRQYDEVALCRGLAWLLDPDGGHRMGRHPLCALLRDLDLHVVEDAPVDIGVEEARTDTRADIVLRVGGQTVIIEAKVFAGEQPRQADRLSRQWAGTSTTLVFLTRTGYSPYTANDSEGLWVPRTWRDVAALMRRVADQAGLHPSAGAREYIETIGVL
jgi:hypothetical protein